MDIKAFLTLRRRKGRNALCLSDRRITVKSGNEEFTMSVTEEEYPIYPSVVSYLNSGLGGEQGEKEKSQKPSCSV